MHYAEALLLITQIKRAIGHKYYNKIFTVGSIAREEPEINDIDFVVKPLQVYDRERLIIRVVRGFDNAEITKAGNLYKQVKIYFTNGDFINVDFWFSNDKLEYKMLKWMRKLDRDENIYYRKQAAKKGYTLFDRHLINDETQAIRVFDTITELKRFLKKIK